MIFEERVGRHFVAYDYAADGSITALVVTSIGTQSELSASGATLEAARAAMREAIRLREEADRSSGISGAA